MLREEEKVQFMTKPAGLEQRFTGLEDIEAIKQVKARYCDDDHRPEQVTALFTADRIWDAGGVGGVARMHREMGRLFEGFQQVARLSQRMAATPLSRLTTTESRGCGTSSDRSVSTVATNPQRGGRAPRRGIRASQRGVEVLECPGSSPSDGVPLLFLRAEQDV